MIQMSEKATAMGNYWLAASSWQHACSCTCLVQNVFVKHQITQVTHPHYNPDLVPCNFWLLPKLKSPLKGKRFQTIREVQENTTGQLMAIDWENCVRFQDAYFEGDWVVMLLCTIFPVSSSINVSICHITWLETSYIFITFSSYSPKKILNFPNK